MHQYSVICLRPDDLHRKWLVDKTSSGSISLAPRNISHNDLQLEKSMQETDNIMLTTDRFNIMLQFLCRIQSDDCGIGEPIKQKLAIKYETCYIIEQNVILAELVIQQLRMSFRFQQSFFHFVSFHGQRIKHSHAEKEEERQTDVIKVPNLILIILLWPESNILDYKWNYRVCELVVRSIQLADAMNWLNTLGGGYSALGDYSKKHAEQAGRISRRQLCLAVEMGDPGTVLRCHLYYALSLMQTNQLRRSKNIIRKCYREARSLIVLDRQLLAMCEGMWSRLKYKYIQRRKRTNHFVHSS